MGRMLATPFAVPVVPLYLVRVHVGVNGYPEGRVEILFADFLEEPVIF